MRYLISLFLVIATPTFGQYQLSDGGGYGYQDQYPIGPSGLRNNFDGYVPQFQNGIPGADRRSRVPGGHLSSSQYGFLGPELDNRISDIMGGSHRSPSRDRNYGGPRRRERNEVDSDSGSEFDSSGDRTRNQRGPSRQHPRRHNYKDAHHIGWSGSVESPFGRRRGRGNNGRRPPRRGRRERDSSSEGSSASSRSSEEGNRRRGNGRNRNVGSDLGPGVITFPGTDVLHRAFGAGQDLLNEAGTQFNRMGDRISDSIKQNGQNIGETLTKGVGSIPGTLGQNGTAITLSSFRNPDFVKQFFENIYNTMNSWGQVLKQLPGNIWSRFERMINCMRGQCNDPNAE